MGYYTLYSIHLIEGKQELFNSLLEEIVEKTGNNSLDGNYFCEDGHTWKEVCEAEINDFIPMFINSAVLQPEETLKDIRTRMYEYKENMNI